MLTALVLDAVGYMFALVLSAMDTIIPPSLIAIVSGGIGTFGAILAYTPTPLLSSIVLGAFLVDFALDAVFFTIETYRLIPFKAS